MEAVFSHAARAVMITVVATAGFAGEIKVPHTVLDGKWIGNGFALTVDGTRMQANVDPDKPFQWDAFNVLDVSGPMIVFAVGKQRYIALVGKNRSLTVTGGNLVGEQTLFRPGARPRDPRTLGHE